MTGVGTHVLSTGLREELANIEIAPDLLEATIGDRLVQVDEQQQLESQLANVIYEQWHTGNSTENDNFTFRVRDKFFEQRLREKTPHQKTCVMATVEKLADTSAVVKIDGLKVQVEIGRVPENLKKTDRFVLDIDTARPALSTGFYLVDGSKGRHETGPLLRMYINIPDPEYSPEVWSALLEVLESNGAKYRAKILSYLSNYPRRDSMVVYLGSGAWHLIPKLRDSAVSTGKLGEKTSLLTKRISPGVSVAWEPVVKGSLSLSFGQHRSYALSKSLVQDASGDFEETLEELVVKNFYEAGIDPSAPYRNLVSPEVEEIQ